MLIQDDRENVYGMASIPYQPVYKEGLAAAQGQQGPGSQRPERERRTSQPPMPKKRAVALASKLKRWVVVGSLVCTGAFGGFIMTHLSTTGTASQSTQTSSSSTTSKATATATPTVSSASDDSGFLQQQQGGDQFGSSSSNQQPVTGSHSS